MLKVNLSRPIKVRRAPANLLTWQGHQNLGTNRAIWEAPDWLADQAKRDGGEAVEEEA